MKATPAENYEWIETTGIVTSDGIVSVSYTTKDRPEIVLLRSFLKDDAVVPSDGIQTNAKNKKLIPDNNDIKPINSKQLSEFLNSVIAPTKDEITNAFNSAGLTATSADTGSGSSSGGGGGSSAGGATIDASPLQHFLADHLSLYFDARLAKEKSSEQIATKIVNGVWGKNSDTGLAMFVAAIFNRVNTAAVKEFTDINANIDIARLTKNGDSEYFRFAWVATHPAGQSGYDAAKQIGFDAKIPSGLFAETGTLLRKLHEMLALSPAPFVIISGPIPANAKLEISDGKNTNTVDFEGAYRSGVILGIGIDIVDTTTAAFSNSLALNTAVYGELAKSAIGGASLTMKMTAAGKSSTVEGVKMGATVKFNLADSSAAPAAAQTSDPAADAKSLSGEANLQMNTSLGLTVGGTRPGFTLENVYMTTGGAVAMNSPQVVLQKSTGGRGDVFELSVNTAEDAVILIPIVEKQSLNEALEHWSETILATLKPAAAAKSGPPHVALKQITWGYEEHYRRFGLPDVGNIRLIAYEPSTSRNIPKDVNVISIEAAIKDGYTGNSKWDPIEYAIAMYIANDKNVVRTRLYTSAALNREMNSFQGTRYQTN
jgi:hypothetical protein